MPNGPDFQIRQSGDLRCVDCLREIIINQEVMDPRHSKLANYMLGGDSLCSEHAKKRLREDRLCHLWC